MTRELEETAGSGPLFLFLSRVGRMIWISRPTIKPDLRRVAAYFNDPLYAVVTTFAQRLQLAGDEFGPIAAMRFDMIDDHSRHDKTAFGARPAQRMLQQLIRAQPSPTRRIIPTIPTIPMV